jgi:hypothetical protein
LGLDDAFDSYTEHNFKIFGAYGKSVNEVNINKSFANFATTQILPSQIQSFFPTNEVLSFKNLEPISTTKRKLVCNIMCGETELILKQFISINPLLMMFSNF